MIIDNEKNIINGGGGVKLRKSKSNGRINSYRDRYERSLSMSFLETSSKSNYEIFSFDIGLQNNADVSKLAASKNKWNSTINNNNKNNTANRNFTDQNNNNNNKSKVKRLSSTFSSDGAFYNSKDELNDIKDTTKPILKLFASRHKVNEAQQQKRNSIYNSSENILKQNNSLKNSLKDTPWGKYFQQRKTSTDEKERPKSCIEIKSKSSIRLVESKIIATADVTKKTNLDSKTTSLITRAVRKENNQPEKVCIVEKQIQQVSKPIHQTISKDNSKDTKVNNEINICQLNDLKIQQQEIETTLKNKENEVKSVEENNKKLSKKLRKNSSTVGANGKKESKLKRSKSLPNSEYEHLNFLSKPRKIDSNSFIVSGTYNVTSSSKDCINLAELDKVNLISNKKVDNVFDITDNSSDRKPSSIQKPIIIYDAKEKIQRAKHLSLTSFDIDIENSDREINQEKEYTNIFNQITGVADTKRRTSAPESCRKYTTTKKLNISNNRKKSEPCLQKKSSSFVNTAINNELSNELNKKDNLDLINETNGSIMSSVYYPMSNREPGSYLENGLTKTPKDKSTYHSGNGFENINSRESSNPKAYSRIRYASENNSSINNYLNKDKPEPRTYKKAQRSSSEIISSTNHSYEPKSAYLRQRLKELENKQTDKTFNVKQDSICKIKRSYSTNTHVDEKYDPSDIDTFIKHHKDRQTTTSSPRTSTSYSTTTTSSSQINKYLEKYERNSSNLDSSIINKRFSTSSNSSETNSDSKLRSNSRDSDSNMDYIFRRNSSVRSSSGSSSSSRKNSSSNTPNGFSSFTRSMSLRSSGSRNLKSAPPTSKDKNFNFDEPDADKKKAVFGSITKVSSAKISGADELRSFSARRRNRLRSEPDGITTDKHESATKTKEANDVFTDDNNKVTKPVVEESIGTDKQPPERIIESATTEQTNETCTSPTNETCTSPTNTTDSSFENKKSFSRFSLRKRNSQDIINSSETKTETKTRKHSLSNYFGFRKNKEKDNTPPGSPGRSPSPTTYDDTRRGSADSLDSNSGHNKLNRRSSSPLVSPTSPQQIREKERKGSGFFKIFHRRGSSASVEDNTNNTFSDPDPIEEADETLSQSPKKVVARIVSVASITSKKKSTIMGNSSKDNDLRTKKRSQSEIIDTKTETNNRLRTQSLQSNDNKDNKNTSIYIKSLASNLKEENEVIKESADHISSEDKPSDISDVSPSLISNDKRNQKLERRLQGLVQNESNIDQSPEDSPPPVVNTNLLLPTVNGDLGSSESLYSDDAEVSSANKRTSKNKERIRNRKAARLEAKERRSLPAFMGETEIDFSNASEVTNAISEQNIADVPTEEAPKVIPKTRKKHKARRSNTEFIMKAPDMSDEASPMMSRDDGVVLRRNNKRNQRRDRPKTLMSGIDPDLIFGQNKENQNGEKSEVVNETLSFADIKKKLLEGLTDDKKIPEKVSPKERQKIKRTKSSKRYKTITEGIAPRDLALAKQAMEASQGDNGEKTIDNDTLAQITAALTENTDKRKSYIVESRPPSRYTSMENLNTSDPDLTTKQDEPSAAPRPAMLKRTKSMTTIHMNVEIEKDEGEPEIKPLSQLKNRFLQAMEETKQKHLQKKTPVEIKRKNKSRDRKDRPHTICGMDDFTMDQIKNGVGETPENEEKDKMKIAKENLLNSVKTDQANKENNKPVEKKKEKKKYNRSESKKLFDDLFDDLEDLMNDDGITEADLAGALDVNPSLHQAEVKIESEPVDLVITGNIPKENTSPLISPKHTSDEPLSDLDFIASKSTQLSSSIASSKRSVRPQRRNRTAANPIKTLQQRDDLINEEDVEARSKDEKKSHHPVVEAFKGNKKTSDDRLMKRSDLAEEAISALRATVDFSKTKLRKVEPGKKSNDILVEEFEVSEVTNLLLQVKGRKKVQTTVVEYTANSLNTNDCYIIVTPKDLICWNGAASNVIEKAKAAELATRIHQKKEMGCKAFEIVFVDEGGGMESKALRMLGEETVVPFDGPTTCDEDFEKTIMSAYMTYTVCERSDPPELIPLDSQCHRMPTKEILQTDSAFVFDFITEVYVWIGRQTNTQQRKTIQKLAAEKFKEGYFKLNLLAGPLHQTHLETTSRKISLTTEAIHLRRGSKQTRRASVQQGRHQHREMVERPAHSLMLMLFEGTEWVIFKEKFCDWPDESRIIRMKGGPAGELQKEVSTDIKIEAVDPNTMIEVAKTSKMVLEGVDLGRGHGIPKGSDGYHVVTIDVKTWHVSENNSILLPDESYGQFHSGEGYVIRWHYRVVKVRAARQVDDIMKAGGMERCCYFFWLGNDCTVNEEGATAVMTIELDQEKGPQIRVVLGKEPSCLLNIFNGSMVIHAGKRPAPGIRSHFTDQSSIRLYCIRNEEETEACLLQVPAVCESLRSRSSFLLLLCSQGEIFIWHGCKANEGTRKTIAFAAQQLIENHPEEASIGNKTEIGLTEMEEGDEPEVFWMALGGQEDYGSLIDAESDVTTLMPRLFKLDATSDAFISQEIVCPSRSEKYNCPFPVLQDDLYNVEQPAIFLLDSDTHCYIWFGWWPDADENEASVSRRRRWGEERRKAMESVVLYAQQVGRNLNNIYVIYAGLEPESFIELFPYWVVQDDITDLQIDEGIEEDKLYLLTEELVLFSKEFYTIDELRAKPPPQGVDPTKLEKYLSPEEFLVVFKFHKETFYKLPGWQQVNWKKKLDLY